MNTIYSMNYVLPSGNTMKNEATKDKEKNLSPFYNVLGSILEKDSKENSKINTSTSHIDAANILASSNSLRQNPISYKEKGAGAIGGSKDLYGPPPHNGYTYKTVGYWGIVNERGMDLNNDVNRHNKPATSIDRNLLWNQIAEKNPELLTSDAPQGRYKSLREAREVDIRDKLTAAGLDVTTAVIIASREVATVLRRPDGIVPGEGASGYTNLPASIRSNAIDGNPQVKEGIGYAYADRYGISHVVEDLATALNYSGDGNVYEYKGRFGGGYPLEEDNKRGIINIPKAEEFNSFIEKEEKAIEALGKVDLTPITKDYILQFLSSKELVESRVFTNRESSKNS